MAETKKTNETGFRINRSKDIKKIYSGSAALSNKLKENITNRTATLKTSANIKKALNDAIQTKDTTDIQEASLQYYATSPLYANLINYLSNVLLWRYKVTPHKILSKKGQKGNFAELYSLMLEVVDGISIETKFPTLLTMMFIQGAVYFTTVSDSTSLLIETIILPSKYCSKVGETQYGTNIITFDMSYFTDLGLQEEELTETLEGFTEEIRTAFKAYQTDSSDENRYYTLDPKFSSALLMNDYGVPTMLDSMASVLDYEKYKSNELERNESLLDEFLIHKMPVHQDKLVFEVDEAKAFHDSMKNTVQANGRTRLLTTYGDATMLKTGQNSLLDNRSLDYANEAVYNDGGLNHSMFVGTTEGSIDASFKRDKTLIMKYVQGLINFYTIAINNWFDFKEYEANIDLLPISIYTYNEDVEIYKANATLGVGKLDYVIASGIKQKNIQDQLFLEDFLKLNQITPMQSSHTQTTEDRASTTTEETDNEIEPSKEEETVE